MQNQKYLMKVDLGGGQYRYLYTQEEVAAYKAGKTGGNQSHGEDHYQYQTKDTQNGNRYINTRNADGSVSRTTNKGGVAVRGHQLRSAPASRTGGGNANQMHYQYQRSANGKTTVYSGTGAAQRSINRDPVATNRKKEQLKNAPKNYGGINSTPRYRYQTTVGKDKFDTNQTRNPLKKLANDVKGKTVRVETYTKLNGGEAGGTGHYYDPRYKKAQYNKKVTYEDNARSAKITKAKQAVKSAPAKAKATAKKVAKGYDNATTKIADKALKATPKVKKTAKNIAKNYDKATTAIADKAVKATPKAKKAIKSAAKNYDNATTKMANAAWNTTNSKTAQKAKKTVSSGAKKASNALTKAWNNLFKKKKK